MHDDDRVQMHIGAITDLVEGRLDVPYYNWHLGTGFGECPEEEGWIFALYASPDKEIVHNRAIFFNEPPRYRYFRNLALGRLGEEVIDENLEWIDAWRRLGSSATEVLEIHRERTESVNLPMSFISFGIDLGEGPGTFLFHPMELPVDLCFGWLRDSAECYLANRNN